MQHLNDEVLARLVDEDPTVEEAEHLADCAECAVELDALRVQTRELSALPDLAPPPALQARLQAGLAVEGLMLSTRARQRSLLRIAASVALFAAGGLAGYLGRGATAGATPGANRLSPPATVAEAAEQLESAEAAYNAALAAYADKTGGGAMPDPVNRLAALEGIVLTTRAALNEAPADPLINGYHLTALEQRDAILRQIEESRPDSEDTEQEWY